MNNKPSPTPEKPQQQKPEARPESVSGLRYFRRIIASVISDGFGSNPYNKTVRRITDNIYVSVLERFEPARIRDASEQTEVKPLDKQYLESCFSSAISLELDPTWDKKKAWSIVLEIYTAITKAFRLIRRPTIEPKAEARLTPVDFEAIDSLLSIRHSHLVDKKYSKEDGSGLTEAETVELRRINDFTDDLEEEYWRPIKAELERIEASLQIEIETKVESGFDYKEIANSLLLVLLNAEKRLRPNDSGIYSPINAEDAESEHLVLLNHQHMGKIKHLMASWGIAPYVVPDNDETEVGE